MQKTVMITTTLPGGTKCNIGVKFINKKGTYKNRKQCETCKFKGSVIIGLFGLYANDTCDRNADTWRECKGNTDKPCKYYKDGVDHPGVTIQPQQATDHASQTN